MGKLDAGQCNGRTPERLKTFHGGASAFDRSMILLNKIVKVLATPHLNVLPLRIFPPQKPKGQVALPIAIQRDLARPSRQTRRKCFAEECLRGGDAAIRTKQKIYRLAMSVDGSIEKIPFATNVDISLINPPGRIHWSCEAVPSLLELRHIAHHPAKNRSVRHDKESTFDVDRMPRHVVAGRPAPRTLASTATIPRTSVPCAWLLSRILSNGSPNVRFTESAALTQSGS
jgi:hypothetical protein